jgi:hypothetical protein
MKKLLLALGVTIALVPVYSFAGKLDDFESAATEKKDEKRRSRGHPGSHRDRDRHSHHDYDDSCHGFFSCLFDVFIHVDASPSYAEPEYDPRQPDRPSENSGVTIDAAYQFVEPGIYGLDTRLQARFRLIHIEGRFTRYVETSPPDSLDISQFRLVYPIRLGRSLTIGAGIGAYQLAGNNTNTGGSFSFPISYRAPYSNWQFDLTPLWASINGNTISDVDLRASYRTGRTNFFVGARAMETGSQLINGPYIGVGFIF